jgi:hypothetical protein
VALQGALPSTPGSRNQLGNTAPVPSTLEEQLENLNRQINELKNGQYEYLFLIFS